VEVYKSETKEVLHRFLGHRLKFPECIAALDAALAGLIPKLTPEQLPELRAVMLANNERVMKEMHKRERARKTNARPEPTRKKAKLQIEPLPRAHSRTRFASDNE